MSAPTLKPNPNLIAKFKAELLRQKAKAESTKEIVAQPTPKIHARAPSPIEQLAVAAMMPRPVPQSTVSTYQSGAYQITEKKTFS